MRGLGFLTPDGPFQRPRDHVDAGQMARFIDSNEPAVRH
jgi:hypothetical protein